MTPFNNHLIISKIFIILYHSYCCYINTLYNLFAHSSCTFLLILLFNKSTLYCPAKFILHFFILVFFIFFTYLYLCIFSWVCIPYNCTVHGADLTYISLLVIFCIIVYVTNTNLEVYSHSYSQFWALQGDYEHEITQILVTGHKTKLLLWLFKFPDLHPIEN